MVRSHEKQPKVIHHDQYDVSYEYCNNQGISQVELERGTNRWNRDY